MRDKSLGALVCETDLDRATYITLTRLGSLVAFDLRLAYVRQFLAEHGHQRAAIVFAQVTLEVLQRNSQCWVKQRLNLLCLRFLKDGDDGKLVRLESWPIEHLEDQKTLEIDRSQGRFTGTEAFVDIKLRRRVPATDDVACFIVTIGVTFDLPCGR